MKQVITEVLLFATFCSLQPERRHQPQGIKAPFREYQAPSVQLFLEPHLIQRPSQPVTLLNMLGAVGKGLFSSNKGCCQQLHPFPYIHCLKLTFLMWTNWRISMSSSLFLTSGRTVWTTWHTTGTIISLQDSDRDSLYRSCWSSAIMWLWLADL